LVEDLPWRFWGG